MQLQEVSTNKSDGDDSELNLDGEISDENSDGEEAGDSNCLGNQQLTGSQFSDASGDGSSEGIDDIYEPIAMC